jgi:hypothetical protein
LNPPSTDELPLLFLDEIIKDNSLSVAPPVSVSELERTIETPSLLSSVAEDPEDVPAKRSITPQGTQLLKTLCLTQLCSPFSGP